MAKEKKKIVLLAIIVVAAVLRLSFLSRGDPVNDESLIAFRAAGMLDFDEAPEQTTPLEWLDPSSPWWLSLSFHDHPPLAFLFQYLFMSVFGENNFAMRLPSAILGIASVYLLYILVRRLYSHETGLLAAAILASTLNHVYVSRVGMQEAYVIFFMLLTSYFFLRSFEKENYFLLTGLAFGSGLLAKYTVIVLAPVFLVHLLFFKREYLLNKKLWAGVFLALAVFSPVIVYNFELYRNFGHFDFQFSYVFGQNIAEWQSSPGKETGSLYERFANFIPRLAAGNSWLFLLLFFASLILFFASLLKKPLETLKKNGFLTIAFICFIAFIAAFIGPSYRFLTMLAPFMAAALAESAFYFYRKFSAPRAKFALIILAVFLAFEIFYSINNQIVYFPFGPEPWLASKIRNENYNFGFNELGEFFQKELSGKMPALAFNMRYRFLEEIQNKALAKARSAGLEPYAALIVIYGDFDTGTRLAKLWILDRLQIYHGWPIINLDVYLQNTAKDPNYYSKLGFKNYYFVFDFKSAPEIKPTLIQNIKPIDIFNKKGEKVFEIYKI